MKLTITALAVSAGLFAAPTTAPRGFAQGSFETNYYPCYANASRTWNCGNRAEEKTAAVAPVATEVVAVENAPEKKVYFENDKFLPDQSAKKELDGLAQWMKKNPTATASISGHADHPGTPQHNMSLSQKRAAQVKSYLQQQGIDSSRVSTNAYGEKADAERKAVVIIK